MGQACCHCYRAHGSLTSLLSRVAASRKSGLLSLLSRMALLGICSSGRVSNLAFRGGRRGRSERSCFCFVYSATGGWIYILLFACVRPVGSCSSSWGQGQCIHSVVSGRLHWPMFMPIMFALCSISVFILSVRRAAAFCRHMYIVATTPYCHKSDVKR